MFIRMSNLILFILYTTHSDYIIMFVSQIINHFIYLYYIIKQYIIIIQHCNKLMFNETFRKI